MSNVTAAADEGHVPQQTFDLPGVLLVVGTEAFVTALVLLVGEPWSAWYLYLIPITLAGIRLGPAGAIVAWAVSAGVVTLAAPHELLREQWPGFTVCLSVFLVSGVLTGIRSRQLLGRARALESTSPLDPLTGVLRHEAFLARLAGETERADRYGHPLGMVALRVRGFDEFTRVFGRYKADAMLEHLARVLRLSVRSTDLIGRLGEDGFIIALPYAASEQAPEVAKRIADAVATTTFEGDALEPTVTREIATSSATYPTDAESALGLLDAAVASLSPEASMPEPEGSGPR
ncbi:MAG: GGDEF domain-containing protein [Coriobacteriia bacterium]|nr:GGDEF domain-containing protein [Coriobacteriia bacterium]MBN2839456.1 GGDEF domain-containing protein [Coriobacteriia bacterium]